MPQRPACFDHTILTEHRALADPTPMSREATLQHLINNEAHEETPKGHKSRQRRKAGQTHPEAQSTCMRS